MVRLVAGPGTSGSDFEAAIEAVTYSSSSDDPHDEGANAVRSISVIVNDGNRRFFEPASGRRLFVGLRAAL